VKFCRGDFVDMAENSKRRIVKKILGDGLDCVCGQMSKQKKCRFKGKKVHTRDILALLFFCIKSGNIVLMVGAFCFSQVLRELG
jgi:hypothetical protein